MVSQDPRQGVALCDERADDRAGLGAELPAEPFDDGVVAQPVPVYGLIEHAVKARFGDLESEHLAGEDADVLPKSLDGRPFDHRYETRTPDLPSAGLWHLLQDDRRMGSDDGHPVSFDKQIGERADECRQ